MTNWSEDLAWRRDRPLNPDWKHWFTLCASMGSEVSGRAHSGMFSGTVRAIS